MQKATTFLWFDGNVREAAEFYVSVFTDAKLLDVMPGPGASAMSATFRIGTQEFIAFNGGPHYKLNPALSIFVSVETQAELDELWAKLLAGGGKESRCGWLTDRFGLSWQVIPTVLGKLLGAPDRAKAGRAMQAMMEMGKLDVARLQGAFDGR